MKHLLYMAAYLCFAFAAQTSPAMADCADPAGKKGEIAYNSDYQAFQGCDGSNWVAFHDPQCAAGDGCGPCAPSQNPAAGTTCDDGSIYVNDDADGPLYTTANNETGAYAWKTSQTVTTNTYSDSDGMANTDAMAIDGLADHPAAQACRSRGADWYLPARNERDVLYDNQTAGDLNGSFPAGFYWSSTAFSAGSAYGRRFHTGDAFNYDKTTAQIVRCVRR